MVCLLRATDVNKLQEAKKTGVPILGMMLSTHNPDLVEMLGYAGLDYLTIENEHSPDGWSTLSSLVRACELADIFPVLRIKKEFPGYPYGVRVALEIGAGMVSVPHINSKEEAVALVRAAKFGPEYEYGRWPGDQLRGAGSNTRSGKFRTIQPVSELFRLSNEKTMVGITVEEPRAFEDIEGILSVKGLDHVGIGWGDLSTLLGQPGKGKAAPGAAALLAKYEAARKKFPGKFVESRDLDWLEVITDYQKAKEKVKKGIEEGAYLFDLEYEVDILRYVIQQCKKLINEAYRETRAR